MVERPNGGETKWWRDRWDAMSSDQSRTVISKHIRHSNAVLDRRRVEPAPLYAKRQRNTRTLKIINALMKREPPDGRRMLQTTLPALGRLLAEDRLCYD